MPEFETRATSAAGRVRSATVSQNFGQETSLQVDVYGTNVPGNLTLALWVDGAEQTSKAYALNEPVETGGYDLRYGPYTGSSNTPRDLGLYKAASSGVENVNYGTGATLDDFFAGISYDPNPQINPETEARDALAANGYSLVIVDGPGIWRAPPEGDTSSFGDTSIAEFLQATLLNTGARWWLEGTVLTIDGSAAPYGFALPEADKHLITSYSYADEYPEVTEPTPDEAPDREDYLSQCPDYEPPPGYEKPEKTPETIMQGVFRYPSQVGTGDERVEYERVNYYNGRLYKSELLERGNVNTPSGVIFKERTRTVTEFTHHPMCKEAVIKEVSTTYAAPDMSSAGTGTDVEEAEATWLALGGDAMYLASESVKDTVYHSSGYLKEETETIRELEVLSLRGDPPVIDLVYNTRTRQTINEPNAFGRWCSYVNERQTENVVVYETAEPDENGVSSSSPARVQRNSRTTSRVEQSDGAPAQLTCSPPEPDDPDAPPDTAPCEDKQEYEYQKALAEWQRKETLKTDEYQSRLTNLANQPKRVHSITLGVPRPDIALNQLYGNGLVASVSVTYADDGSQVQAGTSLTVHERL